MTDIFDSLKLLPCHYCIYCNNFNSKCLSRQTENPDDGKYSECESMIFDRDILHSSIDNYFDFIEKNGN